MREQVRPSHPFSKQSPDITLLLVSLLVSQLEVEDLKALYAVEWRSSFSGADIHDLRKNSAPHPANCIL
jgi:hypothetical protein